MYQNCKKNIKNILRIKKATLCDNQDVTGRCEERHQSGKVQEVAIPWTATSMRRNMCGCGKFSVALMIRLNGN